MELFKDMLGQDLRYNDWVLDPKTGNLYHYDDDCCDFEIFEEMEIPEDDDEDFDMYLICYYIQDDLKTTFQDCTFACQYFLPSEVIRVNLTEKTND